MNTHNFEGMAGFHADVPRSLLLHQELMQLAHATYCNTPERLQGIGMSLN